MGIEHTVSSNHCLSWTWRRLKWGLPLNFISISTILKKLSVIPFRRFTKPPHDLVHATRRSAELPATRRSTGECDRLQQRRATPKNRVAANGTPMDARTDIINNWEGRTAATTSRSGARHTIEARQAARSGIQSRRHDLEAAPSNDWAPSAWSGYHR
jgi:hypothetical protein